MKLECEMNLPKSLAASIFICAMFFIGGSVVFGSGEAVSLALDEDDQIAANDSQAALPINVDRIEVAWRDWMARHNVTQSSIAIGRARELLHSAGEMRSPEQAYPMASLSKAITGMCLNQLLAQGPYSWPSTLADLASVFLQVNLTINTAMTDLTLAQIATHTSGLPEILTYGSASHRSVNLSSQSTMTRAALGEPDNFGPQGSRIYSNANYAILGVLIEAMTGEAYAEYCGTHIMIPASATQAGVFGRMASTAGYGGWSVSVEDYARFAMHWFDPAQPWMMRPADFAYDAGAQYGMGTNVFPGRGGTYVGHSGRWTHNDPNKPNIGALFFVSADGVTVVVNWDQSLDYGLYDDLYQVLYDAL
jgi:CubicO group peptidase (beta-lactamase class C family)